MRIGVLADTHDQVHNTWAALQLFRGSGVDRLVHCGDLTKPSMVKLFDGWKVAFILGNMDRNEAGLLRALEQTGGAQLHSDVYQATLSGVRVGACHGHDAELLNTMIRSGEFDLVLHGHLHVRRDDKIGSTRIINPGALGGTFREPRSVCVFDLATRVAEFLDI